MDLFLTGPNGPVGNSSNHPPIYPSDSLHRPTRVNNEVSAMATFKMQIIVTSILKTRPVVLNNHVQDYILMANISIMNINHGLHFMFTIATSYFQTQPHLYALSLHRFTIVEFQF